MCPIPTGIIVPSYISYELIIFSRYILILNLVNGQIKRLILSILCAIRNYIWSIDLRNTQPCPQFSKQSCSPINDATLFLASHWLLLVIDLASCSDDQSEVRKSMMSLIGLRDFKLSKFRNYLNTLILVFFQYVFCMKFTLFFNNRVFHFILFLVLYLKQFFIR